MAHNQYEAQARFRKEAAALQEAIGHGTVSAGSSNDWLGAYCVIDFDTLHRLVADRDHARKMLDVAGMALAKIESGESIFTAREIAHNALRAIDELSIL